MGTIKDDEDPQETPEDLTREFLTRALQREYCHDEEEEELPLDVVDSFETRNAEVGVLSHVVFVTVTTTGSKQQPKKKQQFVAKFLKPEFPLQHMFEVESYFYRTVRPTVQSTSFHIPRPVVTSSSMIMMEFIPNATTFTAVQGCPAERVVPVATALGQWHAQFLNDNDNSGEFYDNLASPAGIGSAASGMMKETQFPEMWKDFLDNIPLLDNTLRSRMTEICQELSTRRLSLVHDTIHNHAVQTLIHGDCHVANMLFANDKIWLVDWAACGRGNPLVDLAFFTIVSLDPQVRQGTEEAMLQAYHKALGSTVISLDDCKKLYRTCLLNQFLILVIYDTMARGLVQQAKKPDELTHHFNVVNARACHALVEHYREEELPRKKTPAEAAAKATELGDAKL